MNICFKRIEFIPVAFPIIVAVLLSACGGGGGGSGGGSGSTIGGTAAAGGPIVGTVTIKDSSTPIPRERFVDIEADGNYEIDVSDLIPPFMLRADGTVGGRSYSLYSAAATPDIGGTINITPLTDLIIANIATQLAQDFFDNNDDFSIFTPEALSAAENALRFKLQLYLESFGLEDSIDLLRASFAADHTGFDLALDFIMVTFDADTNIATLVNLITQQQVEDDLSSQTDLDQMPDPGVDMIDAIDDFQQIILQFEALSGFFATGLPAYDNANLRALFSENFLHGGQDLDQFLGEITTYPNLVGAQFRVGALESLEGNVAVVAFDVFDVGGNSVADEDLHFQMNKVGPTWLIAGDQRIAFAEVFTFARYSVNFNPGIDTGLSVEIQDEGGFGIDYAIVTGAGLPATAGGANGSSAGLLLVNQVSNNSFRIAAPGAAYNGINTTMISAGHNDYVMGDPTIATLTDNESYTIRLYEDNATPANLFDDELLATYFSNLGKRPYLNSELSTSKFATITTTPAEIQAFAENGGNLTVRWTLPAGTRSSEVHFFRGGENGGNDSADADPSPTATSATLTILAPTFVVQGSGVNVWVQDVFKRMLGTSLNGQ